MSAWHRNQKLLCPLGAYQSKEKGEPAHLEELARKTCATEIVKWGLTKQATTQILPHTL